MPLRREPFTTGKEFLALPPSPKPRPSLHSNPEEHVLFAHLPFLGLSNNLWETLVSKTAHNNIACTSARTIAPITLFSTESTDAEICLTPLCYQFEDAWIGKAFGRSECPARRDKCGALLNRAQNSSRNDTLLVDTRVEEGSLLMCHIVMNESSLGARVHPRSAGSPLERSLLFGMS